MYILILIYPFLGFIFAGLLGRYYGRVGSVFLSTLCVLLSFLLALFIFFEVGLCGAVTTISLFDWFVLDIFFVSFGLLFDQLTSIMLVIITGISFFVHLYSIGYMSHDPHISRFMAYLSLFTFFMIFLVTADNFVQMFIGWEGVGLCSYLLINFWYTRILANKAALKAMIMNRIADVFFMFGIIIILLTFKTTDYLIVFDLIHFIKGERIIFLGFSFDKISLIAFFLFIGAIGKSAQIGLHTWLPDAMEGPTPVSSLLHAATMVTAGIFLVIRCSPIFEYSINVLNLIVIFGGLTAFFFSIVAIFQYDVKKIIAYSTCSQLGYMFFSCGLSNYQIAIFHLFNHAFFKALLFLSAGSIIHALFDEQDMRKMGSLVNFLPFTYICILAGSLAIMGFPFLTGFYSKDLILELAFSRYIIDANFIHFLGVSTALFTAIYSIRLIIFVFFIKSNSYRIFFTSNESSLFMSISMLCLCLLTIFVGYLFSDITMGWGTYFWGNSIFILPENLGYIDAHFISPLVKNLPVLCSFAGMFFGVCLHYICFNYKVGYKTNYIFKYLNFIYGKIATFFYNAGFFNNIYNTLYIFIYQFSYITSTKHLDKGFFEYFGPYGFYKNIRRFSLWWKVSPPSVIFFNICFMFVSICIFFWLILNLEFLITFTVLHSQLIVLVLTIIYLEDKIN